MKILFITRRYPPSVGGMENFAYDLRSSLSEEIDTSLVKYGGPNKYLIFVIPYLFLLSFVRLATNHIELIHIQDGLLSPLGFLLSKIFNKPYTVVLHGLDITYENVAYQKLIPPVVARAENVFCISQATAEEAQKRGISHNKIKIIPLGITDDHYGRRKDAHKIILEELQIDVRDNPFLLTVGRLVKRKGVAWFVGEVMPELIKKYPTLQYLIPGDGNDKENIENVINKKDLTKNVKLLGRVEDEVISALYNEASVFVMPNIPVKGDMEGFGRVLLEASLCQIPIVASGIEGIKDAIEDGRNGVLLEPYDKESFIKEITNFLENKDYAEEFGTKSRKYSIDKFNWKNISNNYIKTYEKIIGNHERTE